MSETQHHREVRLRDLHILASRKLRDYPEGSASWMYWRGVLLGLEAESSMMVTPHWAECVAKAAKDLAGF